MRHRPEHPQASDTYLAPAGEGRIARSWRLSRVALRVLRRDRTLKVLTVAGTASTLVAAVVIFGGGGYLAHELGISPAWVTVLAAWPLTFVATYWNVALAAAASAALDDQHLTSREALAVPSRRLGQVALWSLLAAGVGVLLQQIAERVPFGGRIVSWVLGAAWGLVTMFAVPILALEGCTATGCVKRSAHLVRQRWGEGVSGSLGISAWAVIAMAPAMLVFFVVLAFSPPAVVSVTAFLCLMLAMIAIIVVSGAVRSIFAVALYRYAAAAEVVGGFPEADLQRPFTAKRRRWWRR